MREVWQDRVKLPRLERLQMRSMWKDSQPGPRLDPGLQRCANCGQTRDVNAKDNKGDTPLAMAVWSGHKDVAESLLANKADVNAKDNDGMTPLHWAAGGGYKDVVELLLANNAEVNAKDNDGATPLHWAAANGPQGRGGIAAGQQSRCQCQEQRRLDAFARGGASGYKGVVEVLLAGKADVNATDYDGHTPLRAAVANGHEHLKELLAEH